MCRYRSKGSNAQLGRTSSPQEGHAMLNKLFAYFDLFADSRGLPDIFSGTTQRLMPAITVAQMPPNTFRENLVIDARGRVFVTSHSNGRILPGVQPARLVRVRLPSA
jgi:hypothetical protein